MNKYRSPLVNDFYTELRHAALPAAVAAEDDIIIVWCQGSLKFLKGDRQTARTTEEEEQEGVLLGGRNRRFFDHHHHAFCLWQGRIFSPRCFFFRVFYI